MIERNESLRQRYLREMGISTWFPTRSLPGAASSHDFGVETSVESTAPVESPKPVRQPEQTPAASQPPESKSDENTQTIRPFAFSWLVVDERIAVLAELPLKGPDVLSLESQQLLMRILKALNPAYENASPKNLSFRWPVDEQFAGDERAARQMLDGFIRQRLKECPASLLLIFAEQWPDYLFEADARPERGNDAVMQHPRYPFRFVRTVALHDMLRDASLKKPAWATLQAVKALL